MRQIGREWPGKRELKRRVGFDAVMTAVAEVKREPWSMFAERHGDWGRDLALAVGRGVTGLTLRELGAAVGGMDYAAVGVAVRLFPRSLKRNPELRTAYKRVVELMYV